MLRPFVLLYTKGVADVSYDRPMFSVLLTAAWFMYCLRIPYISLILAAGHYKNTQYIFALGAFLNIVLSVIMVHTSGINGVAMGTLISLFIQTLLMIFYNEEHILKRKPIHYARVFVSEVLIMFVGSLITGLLTIDCSTITGWLIKAFLCFIMWVVVDVLVNLIFFREKLVNLGRTILHG